MTWPLTQPPSSEDKKPTTRATSSGVAQRPRGQCSAIIFSMWAAGMSGVPPGMSVFGDSQWESSELDGK